MPIRFLEELVSDSDAINSVGQFLEDTTAGMSPQVREAVGGIVSSEPVKKIRDAFLDLSGAPLPERLFLQGLTGGTQGNETITELPREILQTMKSNWEYANLKGESGMSEGAEYLTSYLKEMEAGEAEYMARYPGESVEDRSNRTSFRLERAAKQRMLKRMLESQGQVDPYHMPFKYNEGGSDGNYNQAFRNYRNSIGSFGVYFDKQGNVVLKDVWKVDNPEDKSWLNKDEPADIAGQEGKRTGGYWNAADRLGTYREIPIEIRLTKEEWEALGTGDEINPFLRGRK